MAIQNIYSNFFTVIKTTSSGIIPVTGVSVSPYSATLSATGATQQLTATISPSNATNKNVTWSSSNVGVATVNSSGLVTAVSQGSASITAITSDGNYVNTCNITVSIAGGSTGVIYDVFLVAGQSNMVGWNAPKDPVLDAGIPEVLQFKRDSSIVQAEFPLDFPDDNTEWTGSFKYRSNGLHIHFAKKYVQAGKLASGRKVVLIPVGKGGTSFLGGHWNNTGALYQDTISRINAFKSANSGKYEFKGILWHQGESDWELMDRSGSDASIQTQCDAYCTKLKGALADFRSAMGSNVPVMIGGFADEWVLTRTKVGTIFEPTLQAMCNQDSKMVFVSSDGLPSNLPVDGGSGGVVHFSASAQRTFGERYFTAYDTIDDASSGGNVSVTSVSLNKSSTSIIGGNTEQLIATVLPSNATNKTVTWSSSNSYVAGVSYTGLITAYSSGSTTITCTTEDGSKIATCNVTVANSIISVTSVSLNKPTTSITSGNTEQLTATVYPTSATNKSVTWTTSNSSVATVSSSGLVSGVAAGSCTITVRTSDGNYTATCSVSVTSSGSGTGGDGTPIQQQYASSHEATPNNTNPPTGIYNWVDKPRINPDGAFPLGTWNAIGHWLTTYKVAGQNYYGNVGLLLQNPKMWIWNTSTQAWDVLSDTFEWGTWYLEDFWNDGSGNIANTVIWEKGESATGSTWVKIKQTSETSGRCFHPWGYQKNWRSNANWSNNGQPYIVTKIDFKLVKWDESGVDNLANAKLVVNSGADWWRNVGDTWQPDWSTNRDMAIGKFLLATTTLRRAYCTNLPQSWSKGFPTE